MSEMGWQQDYGAFRMMSIVVDNRCILICKNLWNVIGHCGEKPLPYKVKVQWKQPCLCPLHRQNTLNNHTQAEARSSCELVVTLERLVFFRGEAKCRFQDCIYARGGNKPALRTWSGRKIKTLLIFKFHRMKTWIKSMVLLLCVIICWLKSPHWPLNKSYFQE